MIQATRNSLSPLDDRYRFQTQPLAEIFSEASLITHRIKVEILYFQALSKVGVVRPLKSKEISFLTKLLEVSPAAIKKVKQIEKKTRHDVKAVEYYLTSKLGSNSLKDCVSFLHYGLTSEDINNLSYSLMMSKGHQEVILPKLNEVLTILKNFSDKYSDLPILARTHGQAAIPTTFGKEVSVFAVRLLEQFRKIENFKPTGKLNGAVGSFQALQFIHPKIDWIRFSKEFIKSLGLKPNLHTTQINPSDDVVQLFSSYHLINSILIGLNQDFWRYISDDWLTQKSKKDQVGSSTMPQKINPIKFENSEGNLVIANGLIETINRKLPISRLQRDLSDSTVKRNFGVIFGYNLLAYNSLIAGLDSIKPNNEKIKEDLNKNYSILSEALQTYLRKNQDQKAYQKTAEIMKGKNISQEFWQKLTSPISQNLAELSPEKYTGLASKLTKIAIKDLDLYLNQNKN